MTAHPNPHPDPIADRETYLAMIATGDLEPGFFDEHGDPAPMPDDIDEWRPVTYEPTTPEPGQPPF
jgi:hypothetical protein